MLEITQINKGESNEKEAVVPKKTTKKLTIAQKLKNFEKLGQITKECDGKIISEESLEKIEVNKETYKKVFAYAGGWPAFIAMNVINLTQFFCRDITTYKIGQWAVGEGVQLENSSSFAVTLFGIVCFQAVLEYLKQIVMNRICQQAKKKMFSDLLTTVFKAPINLFFDVTPTGTILKRFSDDVWGIEWIIHHYNHLQNMINTVLCTLVMVYLVDWKILLLAPIMMFQLYRIYTFSIGSYKEMNKVHERARNPIIAHLTETIDGNSTIRAFRSQDLSIRQNNKDINAFLLSQQVTCSTHIWYSIEISKIGFITMSFSAVSCILAKSYVDPILLAIVFQKCLHLSGSLCGLIHAMANLEGIMIKIQRCFVLMEIPQEKTGQPEVKDQEWPKRGEIAINDVKLRYRPNTEEVLKGLSVRIGAGEKVGIVGRTGAGKSTLSLALTRIVEICGGSIEIDGQNISEISLEQLRKKLTIIPQDPVLFTGTLRFNVDPENLSSD